jgi:hypothetical protein
MLETVVDGKTTKCSGEKRGVATAAADVQMVAARQCVNMRERERRERER